MLKNKEVIYQQISQQAFKFKFCLKHQRKVEFRRPCEALRLHLSHTVKYSHQPHSINLFDQILYSSTWIHDSLSSTLHFSSNYGQRYSAPSRTSTIC
ncbi:hypothetical protein ARMGADRAFT_1127413 [Armillaria gallica]|uniref:eIF3a PCI domain-containing protein n=1 Tax=Armillaria gallica TaxID=47427 RepID=A0A2H3CXU9_ARMGA|nr:hypothetical protein ARMGADRAFT_1127413 [Armillaria gallica]